MSIGERIRFYRNKRGLTQRALGKLLGFNEKTADVRIAQYESGKHIPKDPVVKGLAHCLKVSPSALKCPDTDSCIGVMHTLFLLEDNYAFKIDKIDGELCIRLNYENHEFQKMLQMFTVWYETAAKYRRGEITHDEYDQWRVYYRGG